MPQSALKNYINRNTCLVVYNKEEIKQLSTCIIKVNYGGKTLLCKFFIVSSKFKPIIGLNASHNLGLLSINYPHTSPGSEMPLLMPSLALMLKLIFPRRSRRNGLSTTPSTNTFLKVLEGLDVTRYQ